MGSTPLNATLVIGMEIAKQFRKANRVEVLNTIILTDGEATDSAAHWVEVFDSDDKTVLRESSNYSQPPATFKYGSSVTPMYNAYHCHRNTKITATLIDLYKEVTGSKVINFHLLSSWNLRELSECKGLFSINHQGDVYDDWDKVVKTRSTGLVEVKDTVGFDVRYLMNGSDLTIQDSQLEVKSNTKGDLLRGFKKFAGNKTQNRLFVQKFTDQVA